MAAPRGRQPSRARRPAGGLPVGTEPSRGGKRTKLPIFGTKSANFLDQKHAFLEPKVPIF